MAAATAAAASGFPWLSGAALLGGPILQGLFGGGRGYMGFNPEQYKEDIILSQGDLGKIRSGLMQSIQKGVVQPGIRGVKQSGAARRLPAGAISEGITGVAKGAAKQMTAMEPRIQEMRRQSILDFINLKRGAMADRNMYQYAQDQQSLGMTQGAMGGLAKLLMLWQGGFFNKPQ